MTVKTLDDLFHETVKDLYYAEKKLVKSLPKMAKMATSPDLKSAIEHHLEQTKGHVSRLEEVFGMIDKKPVAKKCEAIEGLLKEADEVVGEIEDTDIRDTGIISSAQTVEHYEIARYRTLVGWAHHLGHADAARILGETLDEELAADEKMSSLAGDEDMRQAAE
jgi:ferritin-like metal-binding protein YciE